MIALLWMAIAPAQAGDVLLSGGLASMPMTAGVVVPSWRLGYSGGRFSAWGNVTYASFRATFEQSTSGFYLAPRVGARLDFADRGPGAVAPYAAMSSTTRLFGLSLDDEDVLADNDVKARFPFGVSAGGGLDAGITEALSVSAEVGLEFYTLGFDAEGYVTAANVWTTTGAVYLNLWL